MFSLYTTPDWFHGFDIIFDTIGLLICLLIAGYSYKLFRRTKENRLGYFSLAFVLMSIGFLFKAATSAILYFSPVRDVAATLLAPVAGQELVFADLLYRGAFFVQMTTTLGALLLIFFISQKARERLHKWHEVSQIALFVYLVLLISAVSNFQYFVFYLTSSVLLGLITLNYYKNYLNTQNKNAMQVMIGFIFLLLGNLLFIFVFVNGDSYVAGEVLQLLGFLILLMTYRRITKK